MALGFQDCCNSSSYFYLTGIPASVQEFETYYIETLQGESFCAKYVEIPKLNYSIPTYTLVMMTEFTDCTNCNSSHTCPSEQSIFLSQFGAGTIATSTDCYIKTIFPMVVECEVDPPTSELTADGILGLYIIGGVAPYVAYEAGTHLTDNPTVYDVIPWNSPNTYIVRQNLAEGNYSLTVTDSQGNFFVDITCTLDAPPAPASVTCSGVAPSISFEDDGSITINVTGGIPPYTLLNSNGASIYTLAADGSITINNLTSGSYSYTLVETAQGTFDPNETPITCVVPAGQVVNYPSSLCLSMTLCNQTGSQNTFYLTLVQSGQYNNRPVYVLSSYSASIIGNPNGFQIRWGGDNVGWTSVAGTTSGPPQFATNPSSCSSSNPSFSLTSSYTAGGTIPLTALPQNFTWSRGVGYLTNLSASNISLSQNSCPVNLFINAIDNTICQNNPNSDATIELTANGGSGGYSFFYRKGTTGSYSGPVPSPITIQSSSTAAGSYQVYAVDNSGAQSSIGTFTIINSCLNLTVTTSSTNICPNWEDQQGVVTFTLTSSNSTGPYVFYWRKQQSTALQWNVVSSVSNTQTITVYGSSNPSNSASVAGNNGFGTYEFYVESSDGQTSTIVSQTLNNISCGPAPLSFSGSRTVTQPTCTTPTGSITFSVAGGTPPYEVSIYLDGTFQSPIQTFNGPTITINNLVGGSYIIYISDQTTNQLPINFSEEITAIPVIKVVAYTHINEDEKQILVASGDYQKSLTNRHVWDYPIDIEYYVEYPSALGTLTGYIEVKLLTQRAFGPGIQGDGYVALNYGDGYYLGMNNWDKVTSLITDSGPDNIQRPIKTWMPYAASDNSSWLMTYNGQDYFQPDTYPQNSINPVNTNLNNFIPNFGDVTGYYTQFAVNVGKTCSASGFRNSYPPPYGSSYAATTNTNFINFTTLPTLDNCPARDLYNGTTCQEWIDLYDQSLVYVIDQYSPSNTYPPNFLKDTTYNTNGTSTFCNNPATNTATINWSMNAYPYLLSLNGTLVVERTFTFGSQTSPITFDSIATDGKIRVNYSDYSVLSSVLDNCNTWGLAFQIEIKLHTVNSINCPEPPNAPLDIQYYFQNGTNYLTDILPTPQDEYTASLKMIGNTLYPPETFQSTRIINNIGYQPTPCNTATG
jgi:hypothetical protein